MSVTIKVHCIFSMCLKQLSVLEKDWESLVHRPLRLCTLTSLKLTSALRWILNTKIMENNLRLLYVIMIPFMFVTTRTIFLHTSSVFSFRWNILQIICMKKMKCMYLTWNSSGVYLRPKNCNYSHRKILNELFGSWRKEIIRSMNHWLLFCKKTHFVLFRFGKLKFLDAKPSSFLVFGQRPNF